MQLFWNLISIKMQSFKKTKIISLFEIQVEKYKTVTLKRFLRGS